MSKKGIEKQIPKAMDVLRERFGESVPSAYNGYISAFGASVVQSGLKVSVALFENKNASTLEDKSVLMELILKIMDENAQCTLLEYILNHEQDEYRLKRDILDIAVAIKLAMRTFKLTKGE